MMKKTFRLLALVLAMILAVPASFAALAQDAADDPVLLTFDGEEITYTAVREALDNLLAGEYITSENDYQSAIDFLLRMRVVEGKIAELGLDQFTAEEEEAFRGDAKTQWEADIDVYTSYFLAEDTDEARAQARENAQAYLAAYGETEEALYEELKTAAAYEKLEEKVLEGKEYAPTEEEIRQVFEQYAAEDQELFEGNVEMYETYLNYYQAMPWYKPEGYRGIIHILLMPDETLLSAYQDAQAAFEESITDEAPQGDEALKAARDAAFDAIIESKRAEIDDIYARLAQGEAFADLIAEYGEDPGMTDSAHLENGYEIHRDSLSWLWDPAFIAGAFSEKMNKPGDVSDPVVGQNGIHILHYLRDIPGGFVELNDEISAMIEQYLENQAKNEILMNEMDAWTKEHEIVYYQDVIDSLSAPPAEEAADE